MHPPGHQLLFLPAEPGRRPRACRALVSPARGRACRSSARTCRSARPGSDRCQAARCRRAASPHHRTTRRGVPSRAMERILSGLLGMLQECHNYTMVCRRPNK
eukprot:4727440-Pyramimonas_sp.AAC.4